MKTAKVLPLFIMCFLIWLSPKGIAQKDITLEDIWKTYSFSTKSVPGFNFMKDGRHYTRRNANAIAMYDLTTGEQKEELFNASNYKNEDFSGNLSSYSFSSDESKIMIKSETEQIYRRSSRAFFHVFDRKSKTMTAVNPDSKVQYATLSPDAKKVAFVKNNNLYYLDLESKETTAITTDGEINAIINGSTDWVYEEEFAFVKAFEWSVDSRKVAFIRFDEREVPEFTMTMHKGDLYPEYITWKYPKVGEKNADVSVHIYDLNKNKTVQVDLGPMDDMYVPRIKWTNNPKNLCVFRMNRHQNELQLLLADARNGRTSLLLQEKNQYYIDITDDLTFLKNGKEFVWTSERDGYNHIYLYDMKGKLKKQLTQGAYDVTSFYGVDEKNKRIYYQAAKTSPLVKDVYSMNLKGKKEEKLSQAPGTTRAQFSSTFDYNVLSHSALNSPATYKVYDREQNLVRVIEDNSRVAQLQKDYGTLPVEFFSFKTSEGIGLNGWMIKPKDFSSSGKYPVFMTQYSGPGSQQVTDAWKGTNYWWYQMLAQKGYVVACVDPRGTGARGEEFKKMTYLELGKYETIDQIEAAKYLGSLPYTDESKIGIFGWSYGGYMSSLCILKGNDVFKAAIAVAPVTSWKWYDTIYTERYMRTLKENESGYNDNSPIYFADRLRGNYLLVHGDGDDNVHYQHTVEMSNALISANKQFDTYVYPNRNHGIYGDNARLHLYTKMTNFLEDKLKGGQWTSGVEN